MRAILAALLLAGCVQSDSVQCADGRVCPRGSTCDVEHGRCLFTGQVTGCEDKDERDACTFAGVDGLCVGGECVALHCGDGLASTTEECDAGDLRGQTTCMDIGYYDPVALSCTASCAFDRSLCTGFCGDALINGPEVCDGDDHPPQYGSCSTFGFDAGDLGCSDFCTPGFERCERLQWTDIANPQLDMRAVWSSSPTDVWAAGGCCDTDPASSIGGLQHFNGTLWTAASVPAGTRTLRGVWGASATDVYAVGDGDRIVHYDGTSWTTVTGVPTTGIDFVGIWGASATDIFVIGYAVATASNAMVLHYDGATWSPMTIPSATRVQSIWGSSGTDVFVLATVGGASSVLHYDGASWLATTLTSTASLRAIWGSGPSDVYAVGARNAVGLQYQYIHHYDGLGWTATPLVPVEDYEESAFTAIWGTGPNDIYLGSSGASLYHFDGNDWTRLRSTEIGVAAFAPLGPRVLAVSTNLVLVWDGAGFTGIQDTFSSDLEQRVAADVIGGSSHEHVFTWRGAAPSTMRRWDGRMWTASAIPSSTVRAMWSAGPNTTFAVGGQGILHHDGTSWDMFSNRGGQVPPCATAATCALVAVDGRSANQLWTVAYQPPSYTAHRWNGTAWTAFALGAFDSGFTNHGGLAVVDTNDVYASTNKQVFHYSGTTFTALPAPPVRVIDIWAAGANDLWAIGPFRAMHWNGTTWTAHVLDIGVLTDVFGTASDDVFVVGTDTTGTGRMFHFDGREWTPVRRDVGAFKMAWGTPAHLFVASDDRVSELLRTRPWACRAMESACGDTVDDDCDGLIDARDSDCTGAVAFAEIHAGGPDYIELVNRTTRPLVLDGLTVMYDNAVVCAPARSLRLPAFTLAPGEVVRVLDGDVTVPLGPGERWTGTDVCDTPNETTWYALCAGDCDRAQCSNMLDYVEKQGAATSFTNKPACAAFAGGGIDVTAESASTSTNSLVRTGFAGSGKAGLKTDWALAPATRD